MEPTDLRHPWFARLYIWLSQRIDARGGADNRRRLLAPLSGRVIEVGAGNGRNFAHYPSSVTCVLAVEPNPSLRTQAEGAASESKVRVHVVAGRAEQLPGSDGEFDAAVVSLVLCSVRDPAEALAEVRRVLRPGGTMRFYEHVRSRRRMGSFVQDVLNPLWPRLAGGCHLNRDTATTIGASGFEVVEIDRFSFAGAPHILGTARRAD